MANRRSKTDAPSAAHPDDGTVRGRLLSDLVSDDLRRTKKYKRFGIFSEGREWEVIAATAGTPTSTLVVAGDQRDFVLIGDTLNLTRVIATAKFSSIPYVVTAVSYDGGTEQTTFTVTGTIASLELDGGDFVNTERLRHASYCVYDIADLTLGEDGSVEIADPDTVITAGDPICACDMFLVEDLVEITGSEDGINDGLYDCRADFTDNGDTITVHLDGYLNDVGAGAKGQLILHLPPLDRVTDTGRAVLEWWRASLSAGSNIQCRKPLTRNRWFVIVGADLGPSTAPEPDDP